MTTIYADSRKRVAGSDSDFEVDLGESLHLQSDARLAVYKIRLADSFLSRSWRRGVGYVARCASSMKLGSLCQKPARTAANLRQQLWSRLLVLNGKCVMIMRNYMCFSFFFLAPFSAASLSQLRGAPGTRVLQAVFSEASFLTCTLFLRRAASSRAHDGYRAGSRDAPGEDGHAARRSLKSGQGPSRLLRPGEGKEVRLSAKASEAAAPNKPDHRWT